MVFVSKSVGDQIYAKGGGGGGGALGLDGKTRTLTAREPS